VTSNLSSPECIFTFIFEHFMCWLGLKLWIDGIVNSPIQALDQKVVVRHAKTAVSRGFEMLRCLWILSMMAGVKGLRLGCLEDGGASRSTAVSAALIYVLSIFYEIHVVCAMLRPHRNSFSVSCPSMHLHS